VWKRTAVCRIERGPEVNSYSSSWAISYSLGEGKEGLVSFLGEEARWECGTYVSSWRGLLSRFLFGEISEWWEL